MEDTNYKAALGILIRSMTSTNYEQDRWANHATRLILEPTPPVLLNLGFPDLPLMIDGKAIDKIYFDHGISKSILERLYALIAKPKAIYMAHQNQRGSVVVTYEVRGQDPIVIPIHPDVQKNRMEKFNVVASAYPKSAGNGVSIEIRWKSEGLLLWEAWK